MNEHGRELTHFAATRKPARLQRLRRSVVKVLVTTDAPDFDQPWQTQGPTSGFGSGAVVETSRGLRILTSAHVIEHQVFVEVRRYGASRKFVAEVEGEGHDCDLALLAVEDESFFQDSEPIPIGDLPLLGDEVRVLGYPIGGKGLSITRGVVSRIELSTYTQSRRRLLAVQIDAAINSGNSGGPVAMDGQLVGVASEALVGGQSIGYMVAPPVIRHFLDDMENGVFDGFPSLGVATQPLENPTLRRSLRLSSDRENGVLVSQVAFGGSAWGVIEAGDVLLEVAGIEIASDGSVPFRRGEQIDGEWLVSERQVGERMAVRLWRDGAMLDAEVTLRTARPLVSDAQRQGRPSYWVYGGLLLVPLTRQYLQTWGDEWPRIAPARLLSLFEGGVPSASRRGVVVLQKVMPDQANRGYHGFESLVVTHAQGQRIRDLRHLVGIVERTRDPLVRFDTACNRRIVLDRTVVNERHAAILDRFGLMAERSEDLRSREQA